MHLVCRILTELAGYSKRLSKRHALSSRRPNKSQHTRPAEPLPRQVRQLISDDSSLGIAVTPRARFNTLVGQCQRTPGICPCSLDKYAILRYGWLPSYYALVSGQHYLAQPNDNVSELEHACQELSRSLEEASANVATYSDWTEKELEKCLQNRGINLLREKNKQSYIEALEPADSMTTFKFLELPTEIRLQVYPSALLVNTEKKRGIPNWGQMVKPPLLQTCQLIRNEATSIFYRHNIFVLPIEMEDRWTGDRHFPARITHAAQTWLEMLRDNIEDLRRISLSVEPRSYADPQWSTVKMIDIDVLGRDGSSWEPVVSRHTRTCCMKNRVQVSVPGYRDVWGDPEVWLELSEGQLIVAQDAIDQVWQDCSFEGRLKLSMQGIETMVEATGKLMQDIMSHSEEDLPA